jgi:serine/arginine repetitive matrix protein 2
MRTEPMGKVFYSSSAQIGRLIENLSQGMEAGSFNFLPEGHPHASSLHSDELHWTVEERLDHMLHSMGSN